MGRLGLPELIVILVVVLLLFGAKRLPEIARSLGKAMKEFKKAGKDMQNEMNDAAESSDENQKKSDA